MGDVNVDTYKRAGQTQEKGSRRVRPWRGEVIQGRHCARYKFYREKVCSYYAPPDGRPYAREPRLYLCCVFPKRGSK